MTDTKSRFEKYLDKSGECWIWTGSLAGDPPNNYGQFFTADGLRRAHRFAYELYVGPIPEGLIIDHLCRQPQCCNPHHLEPVTISQNVARGRKGFLLTGRCQSGRHDMSDATNIRSRSDGKRQCRPCCRERDRERLARLAQAARKATR